MSADFWRKLLTVWSQFLLVMGSAEGQKLLDMVEYLVKDVMDGPDQSPDYDPFERNAPTTSTASGSPRIVRKPEGTP